MPAEEYQVQDIYRYSRKSYKNKCINNIDSVESPRSERVKVDAPGCSNCDNDSDGEITSILHKKCPVVVLAQQQLQRLLDEPDKLLCDNTQCCRFAYDILCICKNILCQENYCRCFLFTLAIMSFFIGLLLGAASCGTHLRKFNSPILTCIDNYLTFDKPTKNNLDTFRGIA